MCDRTSSREKFDERHERDDKFYVNASFITKKSFLQFIKGHPRKEYTPTSPQPNRSPFPKARIYHAFNEDTNLLAKCDATCECGEPENHEPHFEPLQEPYAIRDPYSEVAATRKYLERKPACFVIFGKPDLNTGKLAAMIADFWGCVLISPVTLLNEEIERGTEKGRIIAEMLKLGHCVGPEIIMNLMESKVNTRDVQHRGYIVEGLPLVQNDLNIDYSSYQSESTESQSQLENLFSNFPKVFGFPVCDVCGPATESDNLEAASSSEVQSDACTSVSDESTQKGTCQRRVNFERIISSQIEEMFTTWPSKPSIIIYAMCPDEDVVKKRELFRFDPATGQTVDTSLTKLRENIELLFSRERTENDVNLSFELYQELMNEERIFDEDERKYLLKRICDTKPNVEDQCSIYKRFAMPAIEKWTLLHNPQNVIRVDARTPTSQMFNIIRTRLRVVSIERPIIPKRLLDRVEGEFEGESPRPVSMDDFENKTIEEVLQSLVDKETVSPIFPWRLSPWRFLCPVELARGRTVEGASRYAVRFLNAIYFLSSSEAADLFVQNPRTFLLPGFPQPPCKIAVFGPKYSGKSALSNELTRVFGGVVVDVDDHFEEQVKMVVEGIKNVPKEEIGIEVWRDGGYVVDGMPADVEAWKVIVEDEKIVFEDVVLLFEEAPYQHLVSKWRNFNQAKIEARDEVGEEYGEWFETENEEEEVRLLEYFEDIQQFESDWESIRERVAEASRNLITCNLSTVDDISEFVIESIKNRFAETAHAMSDEEKNRERELAEYASLSKGTEYFDSLGEELDENEGDARPSDDSDVGNSRLGDTNHYCPVALSKQVFLRGKEEFSALFMNKVYHLSSAGALEKFVEDPRKYSVPLFRPKHIIPPLRVSIVGPPGSGKTTLSNLISREYGLTHVDYFDWFTAFMKDRGMPPVSSKDVLISPGDLVDLVDLPEDLHDEKYNSDTATVQTFIRRYWQTGGVLSERMLRECLLRFYEQPYSDFGVVFDGFPSCSEDVDAALANYTVPELIIELRCGREKSFDRAVPELLKSWRKKQEEKKRIENARYAAKLREYVAKREQWIEKILDERRAAEEEYMEDEIFEDDSLFSLKENDEAEEAAVDRIELEEAWRQEHPEPVLFTDWEEFDVAEERIVRGFPDMYDSDSQKLEALRGTFDDQLIPWIEIDAEKDVDEVRLEIMRILDPDVHRDVSVLEITRTVDLETADRLVDCGYFFLSSFGRWCPVQLHEKNNPLPMILPLEVQQEIHPVIHRHYIYFLGGKEALTAFRKNPLKYLEQDSCAPLAPFRISIIGPPKCGKTTLARHFNKTYGMKVISRGSALRHLVQNYSWTESASAIESHLRKGHCVPDESVARAVEMSSIDPASTTQGFVLDGFPSNRKEYEHLSLLSIQPIIVLDLKADLDFSLECLAHGASETRRPPNFSANFLMHRYANWEVDQGNFRDWLNKFGQNVVELDATKSVWYVWTRADQAVRERFLAIRSYFRECDYDKVHRLQFMCVSPYEFKTRQSRFESHCPLCLFHDGRMKTSGPPPDHRGIVQFRDHFYWICPQHVHDFVEDPLRHLPPVNTAVLPKERPRILTETANMDHACWLLRLQANGQCLVTYVDNLPERKLVTGKPNLAVMYENKIYLFCSEECRDKFLAQFDKYASVKLHFPRKLPPIDIKSLPDLGFLEQTVAKLIIEVVNQIGVFRPKIPGMSASASAAIYIGVYLKIRNEFCSLREVDIYRRVKRRIKSRDEIVKAVTKVIKRKLNPYVSAPVYSSSRLVEQTSIISEISSHTTNYIKFRRTSPTQTLVDPESRRVPVPDTRFDYLCEYFKPASKVPAFLNVVDIAGLVKGAAEGQGLGNSFLSCINACDGIFHLCRAFDDDDVTHIEGDVNPVRDLEIISEELRLKDIEFLNGHLEKLEKLVVRGNDKKLKPEYDTLLKVKGVMVDEKKHIRFADWSANDIEVLNKYLFLTSKPVIYLVNLSEKDYIRKKNKWLVKIKEWVDKNDPGAVLIPFSGYFENKILDMEEAELAKYCEEQKVTSALDKIIVQGYKALQLQYFFTAGHDEVKAWTIQKGTKAPQAAGKIHTDFEKGFIMAEVMKFDDFKNEGSETAVKAAGKYRQQGRNYVVEDGDIIFFKFNAGAGLKDAKKK